MCLKARQKKRKTNRSNGNITIDDEVNKMTIEKDTENDYIENNESVEKNKKKNESLEKSSKKR